MKRKSYRANNPLQVLNSVSATQYEDTVHSGTPRGVQRGRAYTGNNVGFVRLPFPTVYNRENFKIKFSFSVSIYARQDLFSFWGTRGIIIRVDINERIGTTFVNGAQLGAVGFAFALNTVYTFEASRYGTNLRYTFITGGEVVFDQIIPGAATIPINSDATQAEIGGISNGGNPLRGGSFMYGFEYYSLDTSGNEIDRLAFYKMDEGSGAIAYDSSGNQNHGTITNAVTVPIEENPNSIHNFQNIESFQNIVGYSLLKFFDLRALSYYANNLPQETFHQISRYALTAGSSFADDPYVWKRFVGLQSTDVFGVDYIPPTVADNKAILTPFPEGIYLTNDEHGNSGIEITRNTGGSNNYPNVRFEFDAEFDGGFMTLEVQNRNQFFRDLDNFVRALVTDGTIVDRRVQTVRAWYDAASQVNKDAIDATIPNDVDGSEVTFPIYQADLTTGFANAQISNLAAETINYIHPSNITGAFTLEQGVVEHNDTTILATLYQGLEFTIAIISMEYDNQGSESNYVLLQDVRLFTEEDVFVPRDESTVLPPFLDATGGLLDFVGHVPNNSNWVNSAAFSGNNAMVSMQADTGVVLTGNWGFSFWMRKDFVGNSYILSGPDIPISTTTFQRGFRDVNNANYEVWSIDGVQLIAWAGPGIGGGAIKVGLDVFIDVQCDSTTITASATINGVTNTETASVSNPSFGFSAIGREPVFNRNVFASSVWDIKLYQTGTLIHHWPLSEPISIPHTAYDKVGGNQLTLMNGSTANAGQQSNFHDLITNGFSGNGIFIDTTSVSVGASYRSFTTDELVINRDEPYTISGTFVSFVPVPGAIFGSIIIQSNDISGSDDLPTIQLLLGYGPSNYSAISFRVGQRNPNEEIRFGTTAIGTSIQQGDSFSISYNGGDRSLYSSYTVIYNGVTISTMISTGGFDASNTESSILRKIAANYEYQGGMRLNLNDQFIFDDSPYIPKHATNNTDALGNPLTHPQDGQSFLDCETEIRAPLAPELIQADSSNLWFNTDGTAKDVNFGRFIPEDPVANKYFFGNRERNQGILHSITSHEDALVRAQRSTEIVVRDVEVVSSNWLLRSLFWDNTGVWDNNAFFNI